jgi:hypothetical protein
LKLKDNQWLNLYNRTNELIYTNVCIYSRRDKNDFFRTFRNNYSSS